MSTNIHRLRLQDSLSKPRTSEEMDGTLPKFASIENTK
jgi:hypothetical protein